MAALTDIGQTRQHNEDAHYTDTHLRLAALCDGMGGYSAGEIASAIAIETITTGIRNHAGPEKILTKIDGNSGLTHAALLMREQLLLANQIIYNKAHDDSKYSGMGTTVVTNFFYENRVCIAHVGDSRCYRWRRDKFVQLTRDHSLLQDQIDFGMISVEEARHAQHKNLLTKALGIDPIVEPDINEYRVEVGDVYLLCSDGLCDPVKDDEMAAILSADNLDLSVALKQMIDRANQRGGPDNITAVLVRIPEGFIRQGGWAKWRTG
ncbi:MAG: Stp1/IreP family PP2C-type Ser/Thr phosphatase [Betaproteobacteria bacterium]